MTKTEKTKNFLADIPYWWKPKKGSIFEIYKDFRKIATCACALVDDQQSPRGDEQYFPNTWYQYKESERMNPVMEITGLKAVSLKGKLYGRLVLQALYTKSVLYGCAGRMQVFTSFGSASFYEDCGFKGKNTGKDELKYFDPTKQSLGKLFSKEYNLECVKFIPVSIQKKIQDDRLLLKMLARVR